MAEPDLNVDRLWWTVADLIDENPESTGQEVNLFALGLDSIALMQPVGRWRQSGIEVNFAELAQNPTIDARSKLMSGGTRDAAIEADICVEVGAASSVDADFPLAVAQQAYWIERRGGQQLGGVAFMTFSSCWAPVAS